MKTHRYSLSLEHDGDFVVWESWDGQRWREHTRWLVPGTHA